MPFYDEELGYLQGTDTGNDNAASIQPVNDSETVHGATVARPDDNLRKRTEAVRTRVQELSYFSDYDRSLIILSAGTFQLVQTGAVPDRFSLVATQDIWVYPALTPGRTSGGRNKGARLFVSTQDFAGVDLVNDLRLIASSDFTGQRGYANGTNLGTAGVLSLGSNGIVVTLAGLAIPGGPGSISATVTGVPARKVTINYGTLAGGTTLNDLIAFINADAASQGAYGLRHIFRASTNSPGLTTALPDFTGAFLRGGYDAEAHRVTVAQLNDFFTAADNQLRDGECLALSFAPGPVEFGVGAKGGRRQALFDQPSDQIGGKFDNTTPSVGNNLFNTGREPEKIAGSIPIGKLVVNSNRFYFIEGTILVAGGAPIRLGESVEFLSRLAATVAPTGASLVGYGGSGNWDADLAVPPLNVPAGNLEVALDLLVAQLASETAFESGTRRIGSEIVSGAASVGNLPVGLNAGSVRVALERLLNAAPGSGGGGGINSRVSERGHSLHDFFAIEKNLAETVPVDISSGGGVMLRARTRAPTDTFIGATHVQAFENMFLTPITDATSGLTSPHLVGTFGFSSAAVTLAGFVHADYLTLEALFRASTVANVGATDFVMMLVVQIIGLVPGASGDGAGYYLLNFVDTTNDEVRLRRLNGTAPDFTGADFTVAKMTMYSTVATGNDLEGSKVRAFHAGLAPLAYIGVAGPRLAAVYDFTNHPDPAAEYSADKIVFRPAAAAPRDTDNILVSADKVLLDGIETGVVVDATAGHHHGGSYTQTVFPGRVGLTIPNGVGHEYATDINNIAFIDALQDIATAAPPAGYVKRAAIVEFTLVVRSLTGGAVGDRIICDIEVTVPGAGAYAFPGRRLLVDRHNTTAVYEHTEHFIQMIVPVENVAGTYKFSIRLLNRANLTSDVANKTFISDITEIGHILAHS